MKTLKREIYHFDGKDYERFDLVTLTFNVQRVSIENFLTIVRSQPNAWIKEVGGFFDDFQHTDVDRLMKPVIIRASAFAMYEIVKKLGKSDYHEVKDNWYIRNNSFRAVQFFTAKNRYKKTYCGGKIQYHYAYDGSVILKKLVAKLFFLFQFLPIEVH